MHCSGGHWIRWNIRRRDNKSLMNFRICFIVIHWIEFATIIQNQVFFCFWMMRLNVASLYISLCSWLFKNGLRPWEMPVIYILEWAQVLMHMAIFSFPQWSAAVSSPFWARKSRPRNPHPAWNIKNIRVSESNPAEGISPICSCEAAREFYYGFCHYGTMMTDVA